MAIEATTAIISHAKTKNFSIDIVSELTSVFMDIFFVKEWVNFNLKNSGLSYVIDYVFVCIIDYLHSRNEENFLPTHQIGPQNFQKKIGMNKSDYISIPH